MERHVTLPHHEAQALEHRGVRITMSAVRYLTSFAWKLLMLRNEDN